MKDYQCVYFFKHTSLSPIKIGYSSKNNPMDRFEQFKTYAPFGAEIIGFISTEKAKELESNLHRKLKAFRLNGEWFDISIDKVDELINFHSKKEVLKNKADFELAYALNLQKLNDYKTNALKNKKNFIHFKNNFKLNAKKTKTFLSREYNVSRQTIYDWEKKLI